MKKPKRKTKAPTTPMIPSNAPEIALRLKLDTPYSLLGYYGAPTDPARPVAAVRIALVRLHPKAGGGEFIEHFATVQVIDDNGTCILPRYFGEYSETEARQDFWRRTGTEVAPPRKSRQTARQAWEASVEHRAKQQQKK